MSKPIYRKPTKEEFFNLYITQNLTKKEMITILGVTEWTYDKWRKEYGICKSTQQRVDHYQKTCFEKYGVSNVSKLSIIKEKKKQVNFKKYGDWFVRTNEFKQKTITSNILKYGVPNPMQNIAIRTKAAKTLYQRFGVMHPNQNPELLAKAQHIRTKTAVLPSGAIIKYQGYELRAIQLLLQQGCLESEIKWGLDVPVFPYYYEKKRVYKPDLLVAGKIIEVKSEYTFAIEFQQNMAKAHAVITAGFQFVFWIFNRRTFTRNY